MSAPPYMKLFWADYHQDTRHLTRDEHGAYFLLLGEAWNRGGYLPDDDVMLARWALATPDEWARLKPVVMAFFRSATKGRWRHKRISEELASYDDVSRKRKAAGRKGGSVTRGKGGGNTEAKAQANAPQLPTKPEPEPEPEPKREESGGATVLAFPEPQPADAGARPSKPRGERLKPGWQPSADNVVYAAAQGFTDPEVSQIAEDFRDFWTAKAGADAVKLDWSATWRRWVREEAKRRGRKPIAKQVDWC